MSDSDPLIHLLARSGVHSGTELGEKLGISRVAIKKRIDRLVAEGFPVESVAGRGYQLAENIELLSADRIFEHLGTEACSNLSVEVFQSLGSTNSYLTELPLAANALRAVVVEKQPQGQGRRGRSWVSTPYRNLMLSLAYTYETWPRNPSGLSLAFSVSVHSALNSLGVDSISLKWPNDIVAGSGKLGGLLVSAAGEAGGELKVIMGVGINLNMDKEGRALIDQEVVDLKDLGHSSISRNQLASEIIGNAREMLELYSENGFAPFAEYWNRNALFINEQVRLFDGSQEYRGELLGVGEDGQLQLDTGTEVLTFNTSELSLRKL